MGPSPLFILVTRRAPRPSNPNSNPDPDPDPRLCIVRMEREDWWQKAINVKKLKHHANSFTILKGLMLTDMELVTLMPWKRSEDSSSKNGFPLEAAKQGRLNAYAEDAVQFVVQVAYLIMLGEMDWATLPSMLLSAAGILFRIFVWQEQKLMDDKKVHPGEAEARGSRQAALDR